MQYLQMGKLSNYGDPQLQADLAGLLLDSRKVCRFLFFWSGIFGGCFWQRTLQSCAASLPSPASTWRWLLSLLLEFKGLGQPGLQLFFQALLAQAARPKLCTKVDDSHACWGDGHGWKVCTIQHRFQKRKRKRNNNNLINARNVAGIDTEIFFTAAHTFPTQKNSCKCWSCWSCWSNEELGLPQELSWRREY